MYNPLDDMTDRPSILALDLADLLVTQKEKVRHKYFPKGVLKFVKNIKLYNLYKKANKIVSEFTETFKPAKDMPGLLDQFEAICTHLAVVEQLIAYSRSIEGDSPLPETKTDKMKQMLANITTGTLAEFKKEFGHYAEKPFEPACRRYSEYDDNEILKLASKYSYKPKTTPNTKKLYPVYVSLREELRYCALLIVTGIRNILVKQNKDIMNTSLSDLQ